MRRLVLLPLLAACGHEAVDAAVVCFDMPAALPGTVSVDATQAGGEQAPQDGACALVEDGGWRVTTSFWFDADRTPFSEQMIATTGFAACSAEVDGDDPWTVVYGDVTLEVPVDGARHCFDNAGRVVEGF